MLRLIGRRLGISVVLIFVVSLLTFVLESLAPNDVAKTILSRNSTTGGSYSQEAYLQLRHQLGLDRPILVQYLSWLGHALRGDLGDSPISGLSVTSEVASRLPVTLSLVLLGTAVTAVVGVGLGVLSAVRGGVLGRVVDGLALLGAAIPSFWFALVLVTLFAVTVPLFPATGYVPLSEAPGEWARGLVLPIATLAVPGVAVFAKHARDAMLETLSRDFVTALRANGASERSIVLRHGLRNGSIQVVTVVGLTFIGIFMGTVFIEDVFAMPGLGGLATSAATQYDMPMVQGVVVMFTLVVVVVNLLVDLVYGWLNPKVRTT